MMPHHLPKNCLNNWRRLWERRGRPCKNLKRWLVIRNTLVREERSDEADLRIWVADLNLRAVYLRSYTLILWRSVLIWPSSDGYGEGQSLLSPNDQWFIHVLNVRNLGGRRRLLAKEMSNSLHLLKFAPGAVDDRSCTCVEQKGNV